MKTIEEFMKRNGITMKSAELLDHRPGSPMDDMPPGSTHWQIVFTRWVVTSPPIRTLKTYYSMGPAHKDSPVAKVVFSCLVGDAQAGGYDPFEFMQEFGYEDPKKAKAVYNACVKTREQMLHFLGTELLEEAMYEVEPE